MVLKLENFPGDNSDPLLLLLSIDEEIHPIEDSVTNVSFDEIAHYCVLVNHYCKARKIPLGFDLKEDWKAVESEDRQDLDRSYKKIKSFIDKVKIDILIDRSNNENNLNSNIIVLDESWKVRVHHYLNLIRQIVNDGEVSQPRRETILKALNDLAAEVDKERTTVHKITEVYIELCAATSEGAKKLGPAVKLMEKITGAIARLKKETILSLPPPEKIGLPERDEAPGEED